MASTLRILSAWVVPIPTLVVPEVPMEPRMRLLEDWTWALAPRVVADWRVLSVVKLFASW